MSGTEKENKKMESDLIYAFVILLSILVAYNFYAVANSIVRLVKLIL